MNRVTYIADRETKLAALDIFTRDQLRQFAAKHHIPRGKDKADLIAFIANSRAKIRVTTRV